MILSLSGILREEFLSSLPHLGNLIAFSIHQ